MLDQLKDRLNIETGVLLAAIIIAVGGAYLYQLNTGVQNDVQLLQDDQTIVIDDLAAMSFEATSMGQQLAEREAELEQVRADAEVQGDAVQELPLLSPRDSAWGLSSTLIAFAAERELDLTNFDTSETTVLVGSLELPAVSYSIVATGEQAPLLDLLRIVAGVESIKISALDLERHVEDVEDGQAPAIPGPVLWVMSLDLDVIYDAEG